MGFLSWFFVEAKAFELSVVEGCSVLRLVERSEGFPEQYCWVSWVSFGCQKLSGVYFPLMLIICFFE
jgi:hypothetical protein